MELQFRTVNKGNFRDCLKILGPLLNLQKVGSDRGRKWRYLQFDKEDEVKVDGSNTLCIAGAASERINSQGAEMKTKIGALEEGGNKERKLVVVNNG